MINNILNNNKTIWIISILVAVLLWMYVITDQNPRIYDNINDIPIELTNIESLEEKGLVISNPEEYSVNIRVYGRRSQLYNINKNLVRAEADLSRLSSKGTHYLSVNIYGIPDNIETTRKNPDAIEIVLDQIVSQERNIKINVIGEPADGTAFLSYISNPTTATIEGAETILSTVNEVVAEIDITNESSDISRQLPLKAVDINGNEVEGVTITPENVDVTIPSGQTKRVPVQAQIDGELPEGYEITNVATEPRNILIGGTADIIEAIESISTERINIEEERESFERKIRLLLPEGVEIIAGEAAIMLKVTIETHVERTFEISDIDVNNLNEDLAIQGDIIEEPILITLMGIKNQIEGLNGEDISLYIDASNLSEGEHEVPINIDLPEGILLESIEPDLVVIDIELEEEEIE